MVEIILNLPLYKTLTTNVPELSTQVSLTVNPHTEKSECHLPLDVIQAQWQRGLAEVNQAIAAVLVTCLSEMLGILSGRFQLWESQVDKRAHHERRLSQNLVDCEPNFLGLIHFLQNVPSLATLMCKDNNSQALRALSEANEANIASFSLFKKTANNLLLELEKK